MITRQITHGDAIKSLMLRLKHPVEFTDPQLNMFFEHQAAGLCKVTVEHASINPRFSDRVIDMVHVEYLDPEMEMLARLGACLA